MTDDKHRGLKQRSHRKPARGFVDFDYLDKLTEEEMRWLEKFSQEYYRAYFKNDGTDFHPPKTAERTECYGANNARNRDMWSKRIRLEFRDGVAEESDEEDE